MYKISSRVKSQIKISLATVQSPLEAYCKMADILDAQGHGDLAGKLDKVASFCVQAKLPVPLPNIGDPLDSEFLDDIERGDSEIQKELLDHYNEAWGYDWGAAKSCDDVENTEGDDDSEEDDIPELSGRHFKYDPEYLKKMRSQRMKEVNEKKKLKRMDDEAASKLQEYIAGPLDYAWRWWDEDKYLPEEDTMPEANPEDVIQMPPPLPKRSELISTLIVLADKFDQEGKDKLADAVDEVLTSIAARPAAPLKGLDEDVKKDLLKFLHKSEQNTKDSQADLEELMRRLRYFDVADYTKDMSLDRIFKDISKVQECLDGAKKKMYELSFGKKPSRGDLDQLVKDLDGDAANDGSGGHDPLEFFNSQQAADDKHDEESFEEDDLEEDVTEEEYNDFFDPAGQDPDILSMLEGFEQQND